MRRLNAAFDVIEFYGTSKKVHESYSEELNLLRAYNPQEILASAKLGNGVAYSIPRALVEGTAGGCHRFVSEEQMQVVQIPIQGSVPQPALQDDRTFEGWRKLE